MGFSGFERLIIGIVVGNTPQRSRPADMKMAVQVLDRLEITESMIANLDGTPFHTIVSSEEHQGIDIDVSVDEAKFIVKTLLRNGNFGGRMLRLIIPLYERLYPKWEELAVDDQPRRRGRPGG